MAQTEIHLRRTGSRKPDTSTAMRILIAQIRAVLPFDASAGRLCTGACQGCSMKLLAFLDSELKAWEGRLDDGVRPDLRALSDLARLGRKIHTILERNGLIG